MRNRMPGRKKLAAAGIIALSLGLPAATAAISVAATTTAAHHSAPQFYYRGAPKMTAKFYYRG